MQRTERHMKEHIAAGALIATSATLHLVWILAFIASRSVDFERFLSINHDAGLYSGLYGFSILFFILVFLITSIWFQNRDCSHNRKRFFEFFIFSVVAFVIMTIPMVFGLSLIS